MCACNFMTTHYWISNVFLAHPTRAKRPGDIEPFPRGSCSSRPSQFGDLSASAIRTYERGGRDAMAESWKNHQRTPCVTLRCYAYRSQHASIFKPKHGWDILVSSRGLLYIVALRQTWVRCLKRTWPIKSKSTLFMPHCHGITTLEHGYVA